uniref:Uncharacterized protein n=1 Tax=Rhizophora mucronata TaxID=61149 RepID=A0A2P2KC61_RHIMU
MLAKRALKISS